MVGEVVAQDSREGDEKAGKRARPRGGRRRLLCSEEAHGRPELQPHPARAQRDLADGTSRCTALAGGGSVYVCVVGLRLSSRACNR